jgi:hypothetical protein
VILTKIYTSIKKRHRTLSKAEFSRIPTRQKLKAIVNVSYYIVNNIWVSEY